MAPYPFPQEDPTSTPTPTPLPNRPAQVNAPHRDAASHYVWGWVLLALLVIAAVAYGAWALNSRLRARRLGLPPPSLIPFANEGRGRSTTSTRISSRQGVMDWVSSKFGFGSKTGYTGTGVRRGRGGFGALDPDEAWDARVGTEADGYGYGNTYGEEQELGVTNPEGGYAARGYGPVGGLADIEPHDGRERSRAREDFEDRYTEEMEGGRGDAGRVGNPFGDGAERSELRGVSPRPVHVEEDSPTERKSLFRENV